MEATKKGLSSQKSILYRHLTTDWKYLPKGKEPYSLD